MDDFDASDDQANLVESSDESNGTSARSNSLGFFAVIFLTVNATLGAGLLNIPYAFNDSGGILFATIFQLIHIILVIYSLVILSYCGQISGTESMEKLVKFFCGSAWSHLCSISILLYSYGSCITYLIIIGDQFSTIFENFYGFDYDEIWYMSRNFLMIIVATTTILPLCFSKDISFLKFASFLGFLSTLYLTVLVLIEYIKSKPTEINIKIKPDNWMEIFKIAPVLTFSYQCQLSWVPTYAQIKQRTNFSRVIAMIFVSMFICFVSYTWTAVFGLITFGSNGIQKDMMENYDPHDPFVAFGMILLIVKTIAVYPVLMYCGRIVLEDMVNKRISRSNLGCLRPIERVVRVSIAIIWVISSAILAVFVPNIAVAINYLGSLANLFVFILPGLSLYLIMFDEEMHRALSCHSHFLSNRVRIMAISICFIGYGAGLFAYSLALSISNFFENGSQLTNRLSLYLVSK